MLGGLSVVSTQNNGRNTCNEKMKFRGNTNLISIIRAINFKIAGTLLATGIGGYCFNEYKDNIDFSSQIGIEALFIILCLIVGKKHGELIKLVKLFKNFLNNKTEYCYFYNLKTGEILNYKNNIGSVDTMSCQEKDCNCKKGFEKHGCVFKKLGMTDICPQVLIDIFKKKSEKEKDSPDDKETSPDEIFQKYKNVFVIRNKEGDITNIEAEYGNIGEGNGKDFFYRISLSPSTDDNGKIEGINIEIKNVLEFKIKGKQLETDAKTDGLTGLYNSKATFEIAKDMLREEKFCNPESKIGILFYDLNEFKDVNDTLGHLAGDEVIRIIAQRIKENIRNSSGDIACRRGGDEFMIMVSKIKDENAIEIINNKIVKAISEPIELEVPDKENGGKIKVTIQISSSTGFHIEKVEDISKIEDIIEIADIKMFKNKEIRRILKYLQSGTIKSININPKKTLSLQNHDWETILETNYLTIDDIESGEYDEKTFEGYGVFDIKKLITK